MSADPLGKKPKAEQHVGLKRQKQGAAFTLIELLVAVAIIAALASLLFPALARAKATAHSARCKNNLRQITLGLQMYVGDYGAYPFFVKMESPTQYWYDFLTPLLGSSWTSAVYRCPSYAGNTHPGTYEPNRYGGIEGSYGYNYSGSVLNSPAFGLGAMHSSSPQYLLAPLRAIAEHKVLVPADMFAMGDATMHTLGPPGMSGGPIDVSKLWAAGLGTISPFRGTAHPVGQKAESQRHNGQAIFSFCDGHIEIIKLDQVYENSETWRRRWNNDHEPH